MNFVDALRHAAAHAGVLPMNYEEPRPEFPIDTLGEPQTFDPSGTTAPTANQEIVGSSVEGSEMPHTGPGGIVRIELFLHPEQLSHFFRAVVATQHAILTLREAAAYLRVSASRLRALAEEGEMPAFLVEGHWRFAKHSVDEWIALQRITQEDSDAA